MSVLNKISGKLSRLITFLLTEKMLPLFNIIPRGLRKFLILISEKIYVGLWRSLFYKPVIKKQHIGSVNFDLYIVGRNPNAQLSYDEIEMEKKGSHYEELMVSALNRFLCLLKNPVFVDVGAFMGYYACYVSSFLKDRVPVYAIESNPDYCACIKKSAELNSFKNLAVINGVLSDKKEALYVQGLTVTNNSSGGLKMETTTLDEIFIKKENLRPNILKIDVHGAEGKVIAGTKDILKGPVDFVLFELHPDDYLEKYSPGYNRERILSILEDCGFKNYVVGGFRYTRSPERTVFLKTGEITCLEITAENKGILFFDRHVDLFILSLKNRDIKSIKGFRKV